MAPPLLQLTPAGLYCAAGDFHVDPWTAVPRAVVTHAHGDHVAWGCEQYLTSADGAPVLRARLPEGAAIRSIPYGQHDTRHGVRVSLHPAGHILGSCQVRLEHGGDVWVVSGDYKVEPDRTCLPFEPVRCRTFITECTFGLPIYRWEPEAVEFSRINAWWRANAEAGRVSILLAYALGKAQRLLSGVDGGIGPVLAHGAVERMTRVYRDAGVALVPTQPATTPAPRDVPRHALVVAPPSALGSSWARRFGASSMAMASGWMRVRGQRRRRGLDRGFVLSDHADWPGLLRAIGETGAEQVWATHGFTAPLVRWLREERGLEARAIPTRFEGEQDEPGEADAP